MNRMSKKKTGNDDYGKWTYHEYENADGQHGYIISGGLLPDDDAVNRKARELGFPNPDTKWKRVPLRDREMGWVATRYLYYTGGISRFLMGRERQSVGAFYDLKLHGIDQWMKPTYLSGVLGSASIYLPIFIPNPVVCAVSVITFVLSLTFIGLAGLLYESDGDGKPHRVIDDAGSSIMNNMAVPFRTLLSIAVRRTLRRLHIPVGESPKGWRRIVRGDTVVYVHEHSGTPTAIGEDEAADIIAGKTNDYAYDRSRTVNYAYDSPRSVHEIKIVEPSAAAVEDALRGIVGFSSVPPAVETLTPEQSRSVMARLRTRVPE